MPSVNVYARLFCPNRGRMSQLSSLKELLNSIAKDTFGRTLSEAHKDSICVDCGKEATKFRDGLSAKEYELSGFCQDCQDKFFKEVM